MLFCVSLNCFSIATRSYTMDGPVSRSLQALNARPCNPSSLKISDLFSKTHCWSQPGCVLKELPDHSLHSPFPTMVPGSRAMSEFGRVGRPVALLIQCTGPIAISRPGIRVNICATTGLILRVSTLSILTFCQFRGNEKFSNCSLRCEGKK